jgi:hypothetical protein
VPIPLRWEGEIVPRHRDIIHTAHTCSDFLAQALLRVFPTVLLAPREAVVHPLAVGGAMAVYKLTLELSNRSCHHLICKVPHERRLVYATETATQALDDSTHQLLTRLVTLAEHLTQQAPGLFPRCGGLWQWQKGDGTRQYLLVEEFIPGVSVERLKHHYEQQLMAGQLSHAAYQQFRTAAERLAVATFVRLWHCLGRHTFTSDPSPWNVLVQAPAPGEIMPPRATIIDLHSLEDQAGLAYVVQRLAAVYGMRQEIVEQVVLPGLCDALGPEAGHALLLAELPQLEAEAERTRRNLGVDLQRPLLTALRQLR